jgi:hypothetical protein
MPSRSILGVQLGKSRVGGKSLFVLLNFSLQKSKLAHPELPIGQLRINSKGPIEGIEGVPITLEITKSKAQKGVRFSIVARRLERPLIVTNGFLIPPQMSKTSSGPSERNRRVRARLNYLLNDVQSLRVLVALILPVGEEEPPFHL